MWIFDKSDIHELHRINNIKKEIYSGDIFLSFTFKYRERSRYIRQIYYVLTAYT